MTYGMRLARVAIAILVTQASCAPEPEAETPVVTHTQSKHSQRPEPASPSTSATSDESAEAARVSQEEQDNARKEVEFRAAQAKQKAHSDAVVAWQQQASTDCAHSMTYDICKTSALQDNTQPTDDEVALCRSACAGAIDGFLGHARLDVLHRCTANKPHKCDFGITSTDADVTAQIKRSTDGCQRDCSERVKRGVLH